MSGGAALVAAASRRRVQVQLYSSTAVRALRATLTLSSHLLSSLSHTGSCRIRPSPPPSVQSHQTEGLSVGREEGVTFYILNAIIEP